MTLINPSHVKGFKVRSPVHFCNHKSPVMKTICRGPYKKGRFHTTVNTLQREVRSPCQPDYELLCVQTACQRRSDCDSSSSELHFHVCQQTSLLPDPQWVIIRTKLLNPDMTGKNVEVEQDACRGARGVNPGHKQPSHSVYWAAIVAWEHCKKNKRYHSFPA